MSEALFCIEISRKGQSPFDGGEMGLVKVGIGPFKDGDVLMSLQTSLAGDYYDADYAWS